jgi:hypothetical protein
MATEKITLTSIQNRSASDYNFITTGDPLTGFDTATGPPELSVNAFDTIGVTLNITNFFPGRLCRPEYRMAKDLTVLATIVANLANPLSSGPKEFILVSDNDTEAGFLEEKITDGSGILITNISESPGVESLQLDVRVKNSITIDSDQLQFINDELTPGTLNYYGTNVTGRKGWYSFTDIPMPAVTITDQDKSSDYLNEKVSDGEGILKTITETSNGEQTLDFSVRIKNSIEIDSDYLQFVNDENAPGNSKFYGTTVLGVKGWQTLPIKNSIEQDSEQLQFLNDSNAPGNSKFYGTSISGTKGWQALPIKKSIELDSEKLQLVNDEAIPGTSHYYGTDLSGNKGWHVFSSSTSNTVSVAIDDASSGFLNDKLVDGEGLLTTQNIESDGSQTLDIAVRVKNSIEIDADFLQLLNDETTPGNSKFYGTDLSGNKGWHNFSDAHMGTVSITIGDPSSGYLDDRIVDGDGILTTILNNSQGDQALEFSVKTKRSITIDSDSLQLVNDVDTPGNSKFYGTNNSGIRGWLDFPDVAGNTLSISSADLDSGYLDEKLIDGEGILTTIVTDTTGLQTLNLEVRTQKSIDINSDILEFINDELAPGNSKFYGTTVGGVKGWQALPIKNSIVLDTEQLQLVNDENAPGNQKYYGTNISGVKGFHTLAGGAVSITDTGSGYLEDKIEGHESIHITKENDSAFDEVLEVRLTSDEINPGNQKYYGTDEVGVKGWHDREFITGILGLGGFPDVESIGNDFPVLRRCTIHPSTGAVSNIGTSGDDIVFSGNGTSPDQQIIASKIWNNVWNDMADFQDLSDELLYGKCYYDTLEGAKICNVRCQQSVIGIASNTFGYALGSDENKVPIAVSGWVLACVDTTYVPGTPLTNSTEGNLTEMTLEEKRNYPERLIAIYKKKESKEYWGPENQKIKVDNRHWVKVR